ncbi:MAG: hypothetical protein A3J93_02535 [Candidatus Magasanikbacteria bacterium RIFOXYC2_FULL_42_28]|uniref:DUF1902 domain-containing protein n=1 Tax=Candidatus Magasanikbacteria bacterium RIFOXYC2_FULL_42_28 TaxID=1798704 RepID=A0A1F6NVR6_9BACT|nr:MAG: hypothetical protein A3J93_02535 [Candidatus Magasanikbacteria bacterium RIFOXYC2_FULL_42_28]
MLTAKIQQTFNRAYRYFVVQKDPVFIKQKYGIPDRLDWTVEITPDGWFVAECKDLSGIFTQAQSKKELLDMVNDAVLTYFGVPKRESDFIFNEFRMANNEVIRYEAQLQTQPT